MAAANEPDNTPLPGSVFTPRQVKVLKTAVIVMGVLLVSGFAFVLAAIVHQASKLGGGAVTAPEAKLVIPDGATVSSMALDGDRLALHLTSSAGPEIAVIDISTGKVISRIRLKAGTPDKP